MDIAIGEGQGLGIPMSFGGPYCGLFATKEKYVRQMPGRLAGMTKDKDGKRGFVLTLQTREQHIRREKATSNICTNEALMAVAATAYLTCMGPQGLKRVAELCYQNAAITWRIASRKLPGYKILSRDPFFKEFAVQTPIAPTRIEQAAAGTRDCRRPRHKRLYRGGGHAKRLAALLHRNEHRRADDQAGRSAG